MYLAERMHFLQDVIQMTTIAFVSVINYYHIYGLHQFWDTIYIYIYIYIYMVSQNCVCVCLIALSLILSTLHIILHLVRNKPTKWFRDNQIWYKVKLVTVIEGDQKAPFSITTTTRCRGVLLLSLDCSNLPLIIFTKPSARARYDTRSIFKLSFPSPRLVA